MRSRWRKLLLLGLAGLVVFFAVPVPEPLARPDQGLSLRLLDRHGVVLREVLSPRAGVETWVGLEAVSPHFVAAMVCSEDQRFAWHPGFDPLAIGRAMRANWQAGQAIEGGSTITQQLVRNLLPERPRTVAAKLSETYWAVRLEARLSKRRILECYLNRISFGNQCYGIESASRLYFSKPASELSLAQAAFLAVIPRSPGSLDPYRDEQKATIQKLSGQLLDRLQEAGLASAEAVAVARREPIELAPLAPTFQAGHFTDLVLDGDPSGPVVKTTLDLGLQHQVEGLLAAHVKRLKDHRVGNGAVVVLDVESGDVLALAGSADYFDFRAQGQFNAAVAGRQPGSTLKPFNYGLAIESGQSLASLLPDIDLYPADQGDTFIPRNYDSRFHGPVRLRTALACSYNVPAVRVLERVGTDRFWRRLHALGFEHLTEDPDHYGLGLTLGDGEASLLELANAYRTIARAGSHTPVRLLSQQPAVAPRQVMDPRAAFLLTSILSDNADRVAAFGSESSLALPFACAAKTGTSKGYRDNWTIGFTPRYVVAVWVGNFGGEPMVDVSGVTGAGPLFRDVCLTLGSGGTFAVPRGVSQRAVCPNSGLAPGPDCPNSMLEWFLDEAPTLGQCDVHERLTLDTRTGARAGSDCPPRYRETKLFTVYPPLYRDWMLSERMPLPPPEGDLAGEVRVAFPQPGTVFKRDPVLREAYQKLSLKAVLPRGTRRVQWFVDGRPVGTTQEPRCWWQMQPGPHRVKVVAEGPGGPLTSREVDFSVR